MRTDSGGFGSDGSVRAESSVQLVLVLLGQSVKRSSVEVVPLGLDADLVVVWNVVHLVEHHRHARPLPLQRRRLRRRTYTAVH